LLQATPNQGISLTELLLKASPVAKFVLLLLLLFSIVSWAIIFTKWRALKASQKDTDEFLERFNKNAKLSDLFVEAEYRKQSPVARVFLAGYEEVTNQIESSPSRMLSLDSINRVMQSATIDEITQMEKSLSWLATAANASPFIGLFGTVVGIIIAFQGLSTASGSSIQSVAPGIAEALIATAAGIAAAVPAAIFYNYFLSKIKTLTSALDRFSLDMLNLVERHYLN
jgi:biopolymer transport protein TolQ